MYYFLFTRTRRMMKTESLRVVLCNGIPCEVAQIIWQAYHSKYVLVEMLQVTKEKHQKYEELYKDCQYSINKMIDVVVRLLSDSLIWEVVMSNTEDNIVLCKEIDEELYIVFNIVKTYATQPSYLKIELSKLHFQSCDDLEKMIWICDTLQRMLS